MLSSDGHTCTETASAANVDIQEKVMYLRGCQHHDVSPQSVTSDIKIAAQYVVVRTHQWTMSVSMKGGTTRGK